jgi:hypothetical protein
MQEEAPNYQYLALSVTADGMWRVMRCGGVNLEWECNCESVQKFLFLLEIFMTLISDNFSSIYTARSNVSHEIKLEGHIIYF